MDVYPSRIAPILTILGPFSSSRRDLSFETHFVFSSKCVRGVGFGGAEKYFRAAGFRIVNRSSLSFDVKEIV